MKKLTILFTIILAVLFISTTAMAEYCLPNQQRGQAQIQAQLQVQGQISTNINSDKNENNNSNENDNSANNSNANNQSIVFNEAETKREHISGSAAYANISSYNGEYKYGAEFLPIDTITAVKKNFSFEAALEDYGRKYGEGKCKTIGHSYNGRHEKEPSETIDVFTLKTIKELGDKKFEVIGFLTVKALKEGIDSFMVMQKAVLSAGLMQGDAFVVTSEGAAIKPKSSGWGIGTFFSGSQINDKGNRGNAVTGGGGTGYSKTTAELITLPWITVQVLKYK